VRVPEVLKEAYKSALGQDWTVTRGGNHLKWVPPDGRPIVVTAGSKGISRRNVQNILADLRRSGPDHGRPGRRTA
jgi:hypothetical protein